MNSSILGYIREDGKVVVIYVNNDIDLMPILNMYWKDRNKLIECVSFGDCEVWGKSVDENVYYGKEVVLVGNLTDVIGLEKFTYIMDLDGNWNCYVVDEEEEEYVDDEEEDEEYLKEIW